MPHANASSSLDWVEMTITVCLFILNVFMSHAIMREELYKRYKYIGQEMSYLAVGLIAFRIHGTESREQLAVVIVAVFIHFIGWFMVAMISSRILEDKSTYRNPLVALTTVLGCVFVYGALLGWVPLQLMSMLPAAGVK